MFKCCLCGKEYDREDLAVKCVNKCGRNSFLDGKFQHKVSKDGGETTSIKFDFEVKQISIKDTIEDNLANLLSRGLPMVRIENLRKRIFENWENKSEEERIEELGRIEELRRIFE